MSGRRFVVRSDINLRCTTPPVETTVAAEEFKRGFELDLRRYLSGFLAGAEDVVLNVNTYVTEAVSTC